MSNSVLASSPYYWFLSRSHLDKPAIFAMVSMDLLVPGTLCSITSIVWWLTLELFSQTQYVKCDDSGNVIGWSVTSCAAGLFCNNQLSSPVAADPCLRIAQPLAICQTPTIANPLDVRAFCQPRRIGRYSYSTGCKQYIYCYLFNAVKLGALYTCPGVTLFDNTVGACILNAAFVCPVWKKNKSFLGNLCILVFNNFFNNFNKNKLQIINFLYSHRCKWSVSTTVCSQLTLSRK